AIGFHRQRRDAAVRRSALDEIPGVGRERKVALLKWFGSVEALEKATVDEIRAVPGIPRHVAEAIHRKLGSDRERAS
ncbi:MAG: helix-hairpin-helix domain-containing protein, partial [Candidatus Binatia bacterium]